MIGPFREKSKAKKRTDLSLIKTLLARKQTMIRSYPGGLVSEPLDGGRIVFFLPSPVSTPSSKDKTSGEKNKAERRKTMDARDSKMRNHGTISRIKDFRETKTRETSSAWLLTSHKPVKVKSGTNFAAAACDES
jgi:hypothetical protein